MPTLVVKRLIKKGHEKDYENDLSELIDQAETMDGYMGVTIAKPPDKKYPLYIFSARFDTDENLKKFKESSYRSGWLREVHDITERLISEKTIKGLEWWFALPESHNELPQWKIFILTLFGAYITVLVLDYIVSPQKDLITFALRTLVVVILALTSLTYITIPFLIKICKKWLYR